MISFQRSRVIDATPDAVWAVLGRFMHVDQFSPAITSVDALTTGEVGLGSKRRNNFENGHILGGRSDRVESGRGVHGQSVRNGSDAASRSQRRSAHHTDRWTL